MIKCDNVRPHKPHAQCPGRGAWDPACGSYAQHDPHAHGRRHCYGWTTPPDPFAEKPATAGPRPPADPFEGLDSGDELENEAVIRFLRLELEPGNAPRHRYTPE